jgi:hypothetical protein
MMRTTLTLDDDVAHQLRQEARRTGQPFKDVVNQAIRTGLSAGKDRKRAKRFVVRARPLGLRPGLNYDKISDLVEQIEGSVHR